MSRALSEPERRDWLRLARTENVGPVTFDQLIQRFGTASAALAALPSLAARGGRSSLKLATEAQVDKELADGAALGARLIASCETAFPQALAALDPPPPLIWAGDGWSCWIAPRWRSSGRGSPRQRVSGLRAGWRRSSARAAM